MPDRRDFLKTGLSAVGLGLLAQAGRAAQALGLRRPIDPGAVAARPRPLSSNPFLGLPANPPSIVVSGLPFEPWFTADDFPDPQSIPFHASWSGTIPPPTETVDVAIVGGGISGLASAYFLRKHRPVLFDLRPRFGGNAQGEKWRGTRFSLGSAYFIAPDEGSFLEDLYHALGLHETRVESFPPDPVEVSGVIRPDFWSGAGASPAEQLAFNAYAAVVTNMANNAYPEIPLSKDPAAAASVRALDQRTFRQDVELQMGMPLTPLLATGIQAYFYSSFGVGMEAISAAAGWNFVAAEEFGRWVLPGGNAGMADAFWKKLRAVEEQVPTAPMLRAGCRVVDVRTEGKHVKVTWIDPAGATRALLARYVVMAGSKHVCKHVIHDLANLDNDKYEAMQQVATSAYVVANVLLDAPSAAPGYDLFLAGDGDFPMTENAAELASRPIDVVDGNFALNPNHPRSVLTLYWPLPWATARFGLLLNDPYTRYAETLAPRLTAVLGLLDVPTSAVKQIRLSRWGHAMPIARPNFIADGIPERLLRPFQDRVFFVNQDDWALPAIENSLLDAKSVTDQIAASLS